MDPFKAHTSRKHQTIKMLQDDIFEAALQRKPSAYRLSQLKCLVDKFKRRQANVDIVEVAQELRTESLKFTGLAYENYKQRFKEGRNYGSQAEMRTNILTRGRLKRAIDQLNRERPYSSSEKLHQRNSGEQDYYQMSTPSPQKRRNSENRSAESQSNSKLSTKQLPAIRRSLKMSQSQRNLELREEVQAVRVDPLFKRKRASTLVKVEPPWTHNWRLQKKNSLKWKLAQSAMSVNGLMRESKL